MIFISLTSWTVGYIYHKNITITNIAISVFALLCTLFKQSPVANILRHKSLTILIIIGAYNSTLYENSITSIVTVRKTQELYQTVTAMLDDGYKILDYYNEISTPPEKLYKTHFQRNRIMHKINSSFVKFSKTLRTNEHTFSYLMKKLLYSANSDTAFLSKSIYEMEFNGNNHSNALCYIVPEN